MSAAKQSPQPADANGNEHSSATGNEPTASTPSEPPPSENWFCLPTPPGGLRSSHVRCWVENENFSERTAQVCFGPCFSEHVALDRTIEQLKSLHDQLRHHAAECRTVHEFTAPLPKPGFYLGSSWPESWPAKSDLRCTRLCSLTVRVIYGCNVVEVHGCASNGDTFDAALTVEHAEALAHDLARAIARLEGRTPIHP